MTLVVGLNLKVRLDVILVLPNVTMKLSNVRKKKRGPLNVTKVLSNVMLVLPNVTIKCEKKSKGTTKYDKRTITYNIRTVQCEDGTVKYEKK